MAGYCVRSRKGPAGVSVKLTLTICTLSKVSLSAEKLVTDSGEVSAIAVPLWDLPQVEQLTGKCRNESTTHKHLQHMNYLLSCTVVHHLRASFVMAHMLWVLSQIVTVSCDF